MSRSEPELAVAKVGTPVTPSRKPTALDTKPPQEHRRFPEFLVAGAFGPNS